MTLEQQWGIKPLALGSKNPCLDRQPTWPRHLCNSAKGHTGDHCHIHQAGHWRPLATPGRKPRSELRSMTDARRT